MNESQIYKKLSGGSKHPVNKIVGYVLIGFFIFNIIVSLFVGMSGGGAAMSVLGVVIGIAVVIVYARFAIKWTKKAQRQIDKRFELIESISDADWSRLDAEMESGEFFFKTFYFLEDYLYIPKARLLIRYLDIKTLKTVVHSTNGRKDAVYIELTDNEDIFYKFYVKQWQKYLEFQYMFNDMLDEKRARQAGAI